MPASAERPQRNHHPNPFRSQKTPQVRRDPRTCPYRTKHSRENPTRSKIGVSVFMEVMSMPDAVQPATMLCPVDAGRFLGGSVFDFKIEFDERIDPAEAVVRIAGEGAFAALGRVMDFAGGEKEGRCFAMSPRNVFLDPGNYEAAVKDSTRASTKSRRRHACPHN